MIHERLEMIKNQMHAAALTRDRNPDRVTLVAVSKTHPIEKIRQAIDAGQTVFGESRVQEALGKIQSISDPVEWHLIGHLQSNKTKLAVKLFHLIHSVDSIRLIREINLQAGRIEKRQAILLQVNVSGEKSKSGVSPMELPRLAEYAMRCENVKVKGLMTIPPFFSNPEESRPVYQRLRTFGFEELVSKRYVEEESLELSMGMSHDFTVAVEEGATMVRVGTAIFGTRESSTDQE